MSDALNPYQSPETEAVLEKPLFVQGSLSETMLVYLKSASPWLRFAGIVGFIGSGLTFLTGIVVLPVTRLAWGLESGFDLSVTAMSLVFSLGMVIYCIGGGLLLFFLSLFAYRFGDKIRSYLASGVEYDLEMAMKNNMNLWKLFGILCIVSLAFLFFMIAGATIVGLAAAFS